MRAQTVFTRGAKKHRRPGKDRQGTEERSTGDEHIGNGGKTPWLAPKDLGDMGVFP